MILCGFLWSDFIVKWWGKPYAIKDKVLQTKRKKWEYVDIIIKFHFIFTIFAKKKIITLFLFSILESSFVL